MQSYQVPQFLDSGNKILGPLSIAQLIYALIGSGISFSIFNFFTAVVPGIGIFALIPAAPMAAFTAYLALGQYNGRDSDIYILKFILHTIKPRRMTYVRKPDLSELDSQLAELTADKILEGWHQKKILAQGEDVFRQRDTQYKISTIRNLGNSFESLQQNMLKETYIMEKKKSENEFLLEQLQNAPNFGGEVVVQKPAYTEDQIYTQQNRNQQESTNFFGDKPSK